MASQATSPYSFDRASHTYRFNGAPLVSVTGAIKSAGLVNSDWFTPEACARGRAVHMAVEFDAEGDLDEDSVDPKIWPYVEAARKFRRETGFVAVENEKQVFCAELGYAGTLDGHGTVGDQKVIIDWKTGVVPFWCALQTAAYSHRLPGGGGYLRWGVQLKANGDYKITAYEPKDFREHLADFLACARVAQIRKEKGLGVE